MGGWRSQGPDGASPGAGEDARPPPRPSARHGVHAPGRGGGREPRGTMARLEGARDRSAVLLQERCRGVAWELDNVHYYSLLALFNLGELRLLAETLPVVVKDARDRGDLYQVTSIRTRLEYVTRLMRDEPDRAPGGASGSDRDLARRQLSTSSTSTRRSDRSSAFCTPATRRARCAWLPSAGTGSSGRTCSACSRS